MTKITIDRAIVEHALEKVQEFKRRWLLVPAFGNKINKATREAITNAHSPIFELEHALRAALTDHVGGVTNMVTTEPDNRLRKGLAQALRGIANGFDERRPWYRPWSRPHPLIMRTLRRAADELDKEDV